jgi:hypothetical protein
MEFGHVISRFITRGGYSMEDVVSTIVNRYGSPDPFFREQERVFLLALIARFKRRSKKNEIRSPTNFERFR